MDLGAAAEGISQAYYALYLLASLILHVLATVMASVGLAVKGRATHIFPLAALAIVVANHIVLALLGVWVGAVIDGTFFWAVVLGTLVAYVGAITFRSSWRRQSI